MVDKNRPLVLEDMKRCHVEINARVGRWDFAHPQNKQLSVSVRLVYTASGETLWYANLSFDPASEGDFLRIPAQAVVETAIAAIEKAYTLYWSTAKDRDLALVKMMHDAEPWLEINTMRVGLAALETEQTRLAERMARLRQLITHTETEIAENSISQGGEPCQTS